MSFNMHISVQYENRHALHSYQLVYIYKSNKTHILSLHTDINLLMWCIGLFSCHFPFTLWTCETLYPVLVHRRLCYSHTGTFNQSIADWGELKLKKLTWIPVWPLGGTSSALWAYTKTKLKLLSDTGCIYIYPCVKIFMMTVILI